MAQALPGRMLPSSSPGSCRALVSGGATCSALQVPPLQPAWSPPAFRGSGQPAARFVELLLWGLWIWQKTPSPRVWPAPAQARLADASGSRSPPAWPLPAGPARISWAPPRRIWQRPWSQSSPRRAQSDDVPLPRSRHQPSCQTPLSLSPPTIRADAGCSPPVDGSAPHGKATMAAHLPSPRGLTLPPSPPDRHIAQRGARVMGDGNIILVGPSTPAACNLSLCTQGLPGSGSNSPAFSALSFHSSASGGGVPLRVILGHMPA